MCRICFVSIFHLILKSLSQVSVSVCNTIHGHHCRFGLSTPFGVGCHHFTSTSPRFHYLPILPVHDHVLDQVRDLHNTDLFLDDGDMEPLPPPTLRIKSWQMLRPHIPRNFELQNYSKTPPLALWGPHMIIITSLDADARLSHVNWHMQAKNLMNPKKGCPRKYHNFLTHGPMR